MTFDNSRTIISLRIKLFGATIVFLAYIVLTYVAKMIKYPLLGMSDTAWTLILVGIYLLVAFLPMFLNYQFIYFSDDGENIVFRYFTAGVVGGKKNSVEINKKTFSGYKIESKLFGLIQSITLFQRFKEGVAKYPPVYISALTREERDKVLRSLNLYAPQA
jgi:nitrogen fixation/metabolism regulation signal transduction histidine kinase